MAFFYKTPPQTSDTTRTPCLLQLTSGCYDTDRHSALPRSFPALPRVLLRRRSLLPRAAPLPPLLITRISPFSTQKMFLPPPFVSPACAQRRHILLVDPAAGGDVGQATMARAAPARPQVRAGRRIAGLHTGRPSAEEDAGISFTAKASSVSFISRSKGGVPPWIWLSNNYRLQVLRAGQVLKLHRNCVGQVVDGQVYSTYDTQLAQLARDAIL